MDPSARPDRSSPAWRAATATGRDIQACRAVPSAAVPVYLAAPSAVVQAIPPPQSAAQRAPRTVSHRRARAMAAAGVAASDSREAVQATSPRRGILGKRTAATDPVGPKLTAEGESLSASASATLAESSIVIYLWEIPLNSHFLFELNRGGTILLKFITSFTAPPLMTVVSESRKMSPHRHGNCPRPQIRWDGGGRRNPSG